MGSENTTPDEGHGAKEHWPIGLDSNYEPQVTQPGSSRQPVPGGRSYAVLGSFFGDALGAPFAFEAPGTFSARLPEATELIGGGQLGWASGEFTDLTQMAIIEFESIIANDGINEADLFGRFQGWVASNPRSVGESTRTILTGGLPWDQAAASHYRANPDTSAGNGSIARAVPAAVWFAELSDAETIDAARRLSALTHGDPSTGEGRALLHLMIKRAIDLTNPLEVLPDLIDLIDQTHAPRFRAVLLEPEGYTAMPSGTVWGCLAQATEAVRHATGSLEAIRSACDGGGQTNAVAALAGGLFGAMGSAIRSSRLRNELNGTVRNVTYPAGQVDRLMSAMTTQLSDNHARRRPKD